MLAGVLGDRPVSAEANGGRIQGDQRSTDRLDAHLPRPIRDASSQASIADAHTRHPHPRLWGSGTTSSSGGQFFRVSDRAAKRGDINLHYGSEPGSKF
ncbi:Tn3 family transposase [Rhizobium leguminosarum]|uniref:Tn3 family transposase n=1 Tax=Rhizobium leguminosarum TaxID=384 RepID=UPI00227967B5|nr:Tn3 family transposase [Rhizobium leguminosarum]